MTPKDLELLKLYCKIDQSYEDDLLKEMVQGVESQISDAICSGSSPDEYQEDFRFRLAVKKQVKEEYDQRGLSSDRERSMLANGVQNIIHQLRYTFHEKDVINT